MTRAIRGTGGASPDSRIRSLWPAVFAALLLRMAVTAWAHGRFPATADGVYFDTLALRMAQDLGYSWGWADGTVTSVAHYPVGYPAFLAGVYKLFGHSLSAVCGVQGLLGAVGVLGFGAAVSKGIGARSGRWVAWALALHPALWLYTPALMSEGVSVAWLGLCAWALVRASVSRKALLLLGIFLGLATLLRPQFLVFAPVFGWVSAAAVAWPARLLRAAVVTAIAVATCLPWTLRNCREMHSCALVSVNGGWNLAIGAQTDSGAWQGIDVPAPCANVWDEAAKDACFGREARAQIAAHPSAWLAKVPAKLATTLDYAGAAPWYLHASNAAQFGDGSKWWSGAIETFVTRILLALALFGVVQHCARSVATRVGTAAAAFAFAAVPHAVFAFAVVAASQLQRSRSGLERAMGAVCLLTMLTHAVFFGAGRYGLVLLPGLALAAARAWVRPDTATVQRG